MSESGSSNDISRSGAVSGPGTEAAVSGPRTKEAVSGPGTEAVRESGAEAGREAEAGHEGDGRRFGPSEQVERAAPDAPTDLPAHAWKSVLKRVVREARQDELTDRAATLTYYSVLSLFPALLLLVSLLGVAGEHATDKVLTAVKELTPGPTRDILTRAVEQLQGSTGTGSVMAVVGLALALWSASGYVAAFIRAANTVYDVPEGRPVWKVLPLRVGVTAALMALAVASAFLVVFSGALARRAGDALGLGDTALTAWSIARWPVLALLVVVMIALLYWAAPNVKGHGWLWVTPGGLLALVMWLVGSAGFTLYVSGFSSYNRVYGTMAGVIVFLVWLWLGNLALLLGLQFDAEVARQRAMSGGHPETAEPYIEPRDTQAWDDEEKREMEQSV